MTKFFYALSLAVFTLPALASARPNQVPEPGTLSLVGLAVAVGLGLALRKRK